MRILSIRIRPEESWECEAISRIEYAAFLNHPMHPPGAEPTEHLIVERLRAAGDLALSLVAEDEAGDRIGEKDGCGAGSESTLVGHLALSPATVGEDQDGWYLLGPVGVLPARQRQGIGSALIRESLRVMQDAGAKGLVLVGDPTYYARFGFRTYDTLEYPGVPHQYVQALVLHGEEPKGAIAAHPAFHE
jgi:putative acetyltransferase